MLDRSPSSIQTQASRLGLPRRSEESDRHRRRWTRRDREDLDDIVRTMTLPSGKIPIEQVAERVGRSVDAVASRLLADLANPADLLDRILLPTVAPKALSATHSCAASYATRADPTARLPAQGRTAGQPRAAQSWQHPI